jgi:hypothetical protein
MASPYWRDICAASKARLTSSQPTFIYAVNGILVRCSVLAVRIALQQMLYHPAFCRLQHLSCVPLRKGWRSSVGEKNGVK